MLGVMQPMEGLAGQQIVLGVSGGLAAYKAAYELLTQPFYWDKTAHGHSEVTEEAEGQKAIA